MIRLPAGQSEKRPSILNPESDFCLALLQNKSGPKTAPCLLDRGFSFGPKLSARAGSWLPVELKASEPWTHVSSLLYAI